MASWKLTIKSLLTIFVAVKDRGLFASDVQLNELENHMFLSVCR